MVVARGRANDDKLPKNDFGASNVVRKGEITCCECGGTGKFAKESTVVSKGDN